MLKTAQQLEERFRVMRERMPMRRVDRLEASALADRSIRQRLAGWPCEAQKAFDLELADKYKYVR
jgi:hypothetical protein